uniref:Uncharacterized protein n=1 Tax=Myotis myotis TaxID=51298 RepID=A0A7J7Y0F2_MYOMY|nr:hypothetical protein mMyoMyo1_011355 [Myotis myotis]
MGEPGAGLRSRGSWTCLDPCTPGLAPPPPLGTQGTLSNRDCLASLSSVEAPPPTTLITPCSHLLSLVKSCQSHYTPCLSPGLWAMPPPPRNLDIPLLSGGKTPYPWHSLAGIPSPETPCDPPAQCSTPPPMVSEDPETQLLTEAQQKPQGR